MSLDQTELINNCKNGCGEFGYCSGFYTKGSDGELVSVRFDKDNPSSVETLIQLMYQLCGYALRFGQLHPGVSEALSSGKLNNVLSL